MTARALLRRRGFRRLLLTRLPGQFGDGVFQAALAGTVLFDPQDATDPLDVAAGFAVLLLPYSLVGPFVGVLLDRWSRRQVLLVSNLVRSVLVVLVAGLVHAQVQGAGFYLAGLAVFSVNRFVLSALSAGLPHTTGTPSPSPALPPDPALVPANALSTTSGAVATVVGGGAAIGVLQLTGATSAGYAAVALCAAVPYLLAAASAAGFRRDALGPDGREATTGPAAGLPLLGALRTGVSGLVAGARHIRDRRPATLALSVLGGHRLLYGLLTMTILLLYRGTFPADGSLFPGGLAGLGQVLAAGGVGTLLAASCTPPVVRRIGTRRWTVLLLSVAGVTQCVLGPLFRPELVVAAALVHGFVAQGVKICVDSTLQQTVDDAYRGRVFSVYDTLFNVMNVSALVVAALLLPAGGRSVAMVLTIAGGHLLLAAAYARLSAPRARGGVPARRGPAPPHSAQATGRSSSAPHV